MRGTYGSAYSACSRKVRYTTKAAAKQAGRRVRKNLLKMVRPYRCEFCQGYHLGNVNTRCREGEPWGDRG